MTLKKKKKTLPKRPKRKKTIKLEATQKVFDEAQYYNDERADIGGVDIDVLKK